jgi:hypothetical protein
MATAPMGLSGYGALRSLIAPQSSCRATTLRSRTAYDTPEEIQAADARPPRRGFYWARGLDVSVGATTDLEPHLIEAMSMVLVIARGSSWYVHIRSWRR